jgi:hypothetical protein
MQFFTKVFPKNAALTLVSKPFTPAVISQVACLKHLMHKLAGKEIDAKKFKKTLYKNRQIVQYQDRCLPKAQLKKSCKKPLTCFLPSAIFTHTRKQQKNKT